MQRESEVASTGVIQERNRSQVRGEKQEIQKQLKQVGQEESIIVVNIATEPMYGVLPV